MRSGAGLLAGGVAVEGAMPAEGDAHTEAGARAGGGAQIDGGSGAGGEQTGDAGRAGGGQAGDACVSNPGTEPGAFAHEPGALIDLQAYYEFNKHKVACATRRLRDFQILGHSIEESGDGVVPSDLTERVLYWFRRPFPGSAHVHGLFAGDAAKVFIWAEEPIAMPDADAGPDAASAPADDEVSRYYVANVLQGNLEDEAENVIAAACAEGGAHREVVSGGCYAVFWVADDALEAYSLADAFRLLTRCAFGGWIRDNRWCVDFSRRTFVVWRAGKLFFHVPTIG